MTKQEFIERVAAKSGLPKRDAAKAVDAFLDSITETLKQCDEVTFSGFGKFSTSRRRAGRNLGRAAVELRQEARDLDRSHKAFIGRIESARKTLREIAQSA